VVGASAIAAIIGYETIGSPWHVTVGALAGILVAVIVPVRGEGGTRP
jgi:predicted branched-subunit amino acid permease